MFCSGRSRKWKDRGAAAEIEVNGRKEDRRKGLARVFCKKKKLDLEGEEGKRGVVQKFS